MSELAKTRRFTVKIARRVPELEPFRSYWLSWQNHPQSDLELYLTVVEAAAGARAPYVIVLLCDEEPTAMLVGTLEEQRMRFKIGFLKTSAPKTRILSLAYGGILGDQSQETTELLLGAVVQCLRKKEAHLAVFHNVRQESKLYESALNLPGVLMRDHAPMSEVHYVMDLPESIELVYQRLSHDHRKRLRQTEKKLLAANRDQIRLHKYSMQSDLPALLAHVDEVARKTYQRALGVGFRETAVILSWLQLAAKKNWLRAYVLEVCGQPWAFVIGTVYRATFHLDYIGYDPSFSQYSPGTALLTRVMEDLCSEGGIREFDFEFGSELYKERFGNRKGFESRVHLFGLNARGLTVNIMRLCAAVLERSIRGLLERSNFFDKLKTLWRAQLKKRQLPVASADAK